jgi:hypothetical protein
MIRAVKRFHGINFIEEESTYLNLLSIGWRRENWEISFDRGNEYRWYFSRRLFRR